MWQDKDRIQRTRGAGMESPTFWKKSRVVSIHFLHTRISKVTDRGSLPYFFLVEKFYSRSDIYGIIDETFWFFFDHGCWFLECIFAPNTPCHEVIGAQSRSMHGLMSPSLLNALRLYEPLLSICIYACTTLWILREKKLGHGPGTLLDVDTSSGIIYGWFAFSRFGSSRRA